MSCRAYDSSSVMPDPVQYAASTAVVGRVARWSEHAVQQPRRSRRFVFAKCLPIACQCLLTWETLQVGHWLGLLHVFAGGCDSSTGGDFVEDTRAAAAADYSCTPTNTCPNLSGTNPIHNFMGECPSALHINFVSSTVRARARTMSALPALTEVSTLTDGSCYGCWALPLSTDFHLPVPAYAPWQPKEVECVCASTHAGHPFCCAFRRLHRRRLPHGVLRRPDCPHPEHVAAVPRELRLRRRRRIRRHVAGAV